MTADKAAEIATEALGFIVLGSMAWAFISWLWQSGWLATLVAWAIILGLGGLALAHLPSSGLEGMIGVVLVGWWMTHALDHWDD
jgi:hypothetical protein